MRQQIRNHRKLSKLLRQWNIKAHIPDLSIVATKRTEKRRIFTEDKFLYDEQSDTYICPAGNTLKKKSLHMSRQSIDYGAPKKVCAKCNMREQCTESEPPASLLAGGSLSIIESIFLEPVSGEYLFARALVSK